MLQQLRPLKQCSKHYNKMQRNKIYQKQILLQDSAANQSSDARSHQCHQITEMMQT